MHTKVYHTSGLHTQVIAFKELHKFPPLSRNMYAEVLGTREDESLDHPLYFTGNVVQRCVQKFTVARTLASTSGDSLLQAMPVQQILILL